MSLLNNGIVTFNRRYAKEGRCGLCQPSPSWEEWNGILQPTPVLPHTPLPRGYTPPRTTPTQHHRLGLPVQPRYHAAGPTARPRYTAPHDAHYTRTPTLLPYVTRFCRATYALGWFATRVPQRRRTPRCEHGSRICRRHTRATTTHLFGLTDIAGLDCGRTALRTGLRAPDAALPGLHLVCGLVFRTAAYWVLL